MDLFSFFKAAGSANATRGDSKSKMKADTAKKRKSQVDLHFCIYEGCYKTISQGNTVKFSIPKLFGLACILKISIIKFDIAACI